MSGPLRLLWVFSTFAVGGPQRRMATLAGALGPGYEHGILAMDGRYDAEALLPDAVRWRRVEAQVKKGGFVSLANLRTIRGVLREERPDLLLTSNWGCFEWLLANRGGGAVPHLHFEDGFGPDERPDAQNPKRAFARRVAFRRKTLEFVAPSRVLEDVFTQVWRADPARVHLIPNGVDCARFAVAARPERAPTIGTVAALRREKRLDRLIGCFAALDASQARLLIVGDGPERGDLVLQAAPLGERAVFAGEQEDVAPYLAEMDVFAMSSDTEQMPIGLVEAMAAGLPATATDVGDTRAMLSEDNRRFVTPVGDDDGLRASLAALIADPALRTRLGAANARKAREDYGLDRMAERYDALFRRMAAG